MLSRGLDVEPRAEVKRLTDVALALLILVALAPLTLLAMLAVAVSSGRPLFTGRRSATADVPI
jgi:lipopolysaccharide/colanic/teichoic acid biosynthesis glycosyltransferase